MLIKLAKKSLVMLAAKLRNTSFCNKMGFLKVLVKGHIILFDKTLVLTKDHERERYTPFLCNHLGDHWENIGRKYRHFASVFSLSLQTTSC